MKRRVQTLATLANFMREDGDCLIWTGGTTGKGTTPAVNHGGTTISARRLVALLNGHPLALQDAAGQLERGIWRHTCGDHRCVSTEHATRVTRQQHMSEITKISNTGTAHAIKTAKITATRRQRDGKIKAEEIPAILSANTRAEDEAAQRGVSPSIIYRLRSRDTSRRSGGVFSGLGARP